MSDRPEDDSTPGSGPIFEVTVVTTVLVDAETEAQARHEVEEAGIDGLAYETSEGGWLGQTRVLAVTPLPQDRLEQRQKELGSDGTFFPSTARPKPYDAESEVIRLQASQGWSSETMSMLMHLFLRDKDLLGVFAERLREVAQAEADYAAEDEPTGP